MCLHGRSSGFELYSESIPVSPGPAPFAYARQMP